ncbi:MAG: DUF2298 domain-containing protein [Lachnospiraceae bacterium]
MSKVIKKNKALVIKAVIALLAIGGAVFLLGDDALPFMSWWLMIWLLGCAFMPLAGLLFAGFDDKGWMFSKVLGILVTGYLTWVLVTAGILPFTPLSCTIITAVCIVGFLAAEVLLTKKGKSSFPIKKGNLIFGEELIFFVIFLMWTYFTGFRPAAYGTEKFMDYAFMETMMRSTTLPAPDMWFSGEAINYYYGGQYFATFLTKLTQTHVEQTYHIMRTMVAGFAFVLPFSIVRQIYKDRVLADKQKHNWKISTAAGVLAGAAVSIAGNMHYVIYSIVLPVLRKTFLIEGEFEDYWFANSTRYIGHNPQNNDRTIHEFPSYSFFIADLHAHLVNIMFVLLLIGILYAWTKKKNTKRLLEPAVIASGVLVGVFQWTNTWDSAIYYVVACGTFFFGNFLKHKDDAKKALGISVIQWLEILVIAVVASLPFTLQFESMAQGVALAQNHSAFYQLCVLWALPVFLTVSYLVSVLRPLLKRRQTKYFFYRITKSDMFIVILGLCAIGLIVLPELVYVRDIYETTSARSNTMFKLTYQAYIMFGMVMAYAVVRFMNAKFSRIRKIIGTAGLVGILLTCGFFVHTVPVWYGAVWKKSEYKGLNATAFLYDDFPDDANAIYWLKDNIEGSPVVLEANGDSFSNYNRVSAMTGLPTVLGWYVHEWLWRDDTPTLDQRAEDIKTIYTSTDTQAVEELIDKYQISYIFVGSTEREKYPEMNEDAIKNLGEVVYADTAFIVKVR